MQIRQLVVFLGIGLSATYSLASEVGGKTPSQRYRHRPLTPYRIICNTPLTTSTNAQLRPVSETDSELEETPLPTSSIPVASDEIESEDDQEIIQIACHAQRTESAEPIIQGQKKN
jgi:hypothetical protein